MTRATFGLAVAMLTTAPALGQALKPEDVIKKAIEAYGGAEVLNKYQAGQADIKGKVFIAGMEFPYTGSMAFSVPGKVRVDSVLEIMGVKITLLQIINGKEVHQIEGGKTAPLSAAMKEELLQTPTLSEMSLITPLLNSEKYTLSLGKDVEVNGKQTSVVNVKAKGLNDIKLCFDKKTGLLERMERKALDPISHKLDPTSRKEVTEATDFSDYKKVSGMVVPMKSNVLHDGKPFMTVTITDYKPLEKGKIDEKLFKAAD